MFANDNAASPVPRSVLRCITSKLVPTVLCEIPRYKLDTLFTFQPV